MKTSELIKQLQDLIAKHGDCEVLIDQYSDDGGPGEVNVPNVNYEDQVDDEWGNVHHKIITISR